jgi:hypothetical protein
VPVDIGGDEAVGEPGAEQEMIDPEAGISRERVSKIVPEGVDCLSRMKRAKRIGPALFEQSEAVTSTPFRAHRRALGAQAATS